MKYPGTRAMTLVFLMIPLICWAETPAIRQVPGPVQKQITVPKEIKKIDPPLGKLVFTSPKTGDHLVSGREFVIQWSAEGYVPEKCVKIELTQMPFENSFMINPRVCVNGYRWNVPQNIGGNNYSIQLTTLDDKIKVISSRFNFLSSKSDLTIESAYTTPKEPTTLDRDKLKLNVSIVNLQGGRAVPSQARITFAKYGDNSPLFTKIFDVPALDFGKRYAYSMPWPPGIPLVPGGFSFRVDVDITNVVDEQTEGNNHIDQYVLVQGNPNLIVCVKDHLEAVTTIEAKLAAIIKNTGEIAAGQSVARWWIEGHGTQSYNVPSLAPGQEYEIKRHVTWLTGGTDSFTVEVDKNNQLQELSETDNKKSGTIHRHVWGTPIAPFDNSPHCP